MINQSLQQRRAEIAREIEALKAEDKDLAHAERILQRLLQNSGPPAKRQAAKSNIEEASAESARAASARGRRPKSGDKSQKDLVIEALSRSSEPWLNVRDIIQEVHDLSGVAIPRKTLSPLLSYLKRDGVIARKGRSVALHVRAAAGKKSTARSKHVS